MYNFDIKLTGKKEKLNLKRHRNIIYPTDISDIPISFLSHSASELSTMFRFFASEMTKLSDLITFIIVFMIFVLINAYNVNQDCHS